MEKINEFIHAEISRLEVANGNSVCYCSFQGEKMVMQFDVYNNDCFFDTNGWNYRIDIFIDTTYFEKYEESFDIIFKEQAICCNMQARLFEMVQCRLIGLNRKIFLEGIILQLIHLTQKNPMLLQLQCDTCVIANKPHEVEKIEMARNYIINHLDQNITIPLLASHVGTNQCYLKKGFKEVIGTTIFEFLQENRMNTAKQLLHGGMFSVSDVSIKVGYRSVSSFSQAFKNYFGLKPSVFQRNIIAAN